MNWLRLFITGLLLAEAPFLLKTDNYTFFYSLLGYGLVMVAYLYKKRKSAGDWAIFALAAGIVLSGLLNRFFLWQLSQLLFFAAVAAAYAAPSAKNAIATFSLVLIFAAGAFLSVHIGNAMGFVSYRAFILNSQYFFLSALAGVFIVNYKEVARANP